MKCTYLCLQYVPPDAASSSASSRWGRRVAQCAACSMGNNGLPCRASGHLDHVSGAVGRQPRSDTALGFHPALRLRIKQPRPITYLCSVGSSWCTSSSAPSRCGRRVAECAACSTGRGGCRGEQANVCSRWAVQWLCLLVKQPRPPRRIKTIWIT
jgi:hypothetical protein